MDKEHTILVITTNMKENLKIVTKMDMEFKLIQMDINIKVNGMMILDKEKDYILLMNLLFTMEFFKIVMIILKINIKEHFLEL